MEEDKIKGYQKEIKEAKDLLKETTKASEKTKLNKRIEKYTKWTANRKSDIKDIKSKISSKEKFEKYYDKWRTFQASDHLPLWVEIKIDYSDQYLDKLLEN